MPKKIWKDTYYVTAYELARQGLGDIKLARAMSITTVTLRKWRKRNPAFRDAIKRGREYHQGDGAKTFADYVYKRLPEDLMKLWDRINEIDQEENGQKRIEALLSDAGKNARMHLFLYAYVESNFNCSEACGKINISRKTFETWVHEEPDFLRLLDELDIAKKDFFEGGLVRLVKRGDTAATIFANKTYNSDRGYSDKLQVSGEITHNHTHVTVPIDQLDLDVDTLKQLLHAVRKHKQNTIDERQAIGVES